MPWSQNLPSKSALAFKQFTKKMFDFWTWRLKKWGGGRRVQARFLNIKYLLSCYIRIALRQAEIGERPADWTRLENAKLIQVKTSKFALFGTAASIYEWGTIRIPLAHL
jgi:hypothetical protein